MPAHRRRRAVGPPGALPSPAEAGPSAVAAVVEPAVPPRDGAREDGARKDGAREDGGRQDRAREDDDERLRAERPPHHDRGV